jgi:F420-dependent oxidoreductase-like protein
MIVGLTLSPGPATNAVDTYIESAALAAAAGVRSVWIGQFFDIDAFTIAALVARAVPDINVGTAVVPIYPRHPLVVAAQALTAQAASNGRFQLGLGLGSAPLLRASYGAEPVRMIRHLREYLTALRSVLETGTVDLHGETLTAVAPMPVVVAGAAQPPPILLGVAGGEQSLRVAGELADGVFPYLASPSTIADRIVPTITTAAHRVGRSNPRIIAVVPPVVTSDVETVRAKAVAHMAFYDDVPAAQASVAREGVEHAHDMAVIGEEETVAAEIRRYFDAGATEVSVAYSHIGTAEEHRRTIELLGDLNRTSAVNPR